MDLIQPGNLTSGFRTTKELVRFLYLFPQEERVRYAFLLSIELCREL